MVLPLILAVLGLAIGPLLGIVVDRAVERERPEPFHRCRDCGTALGSRSLVPIASWFIPCPTDPTHRRWRYPLTDVVTAVAFAVAGARFGWSWQLGPYLALFAALVVMSVIDLETHLLLNILTGPALAVGLFLVLTLSGANNYDDGIWPALIGAGLYGGMMFFFWRLYPPGMGMGDAKLAPTLGLFLGWMTTTPVNAIRIVLFAMIISFLGHAIIGLSLRAFRRIGAGAELPMGPALAIGAVAMIVLSDQLLVAG